MKPWQSVVLRHPWEIRPTFHRPLAAEFESADMLDPGASEKHSRWTTACGLLMEELRWIERRTVKGYEQHEFVRDHHDWTWLRLDNAEAIGRPCGNCFRDPSASGRNEETP